MNKTQNYNWNNHTNKKKLTTSYKNQTRILETNIIAKLNILQNQIYKNITTQ